MFQKIIIVALLATLAMTPTANASPTLKANTGLGLGIAFPDGEATALAPSIKLDLGLVIPMSERWGWYTAVGASVSTSADYPSWRIMTGPGLRLSDRFGLGFSFLYQFRPAYTDNENWSHLLAISIAPSVSITKGISLAFVVGPGVVLGGDDPVWSIAFQPKLSFVLPSW